MRGTWEKQGKPFSEINSLQPQVHSYMQTIWMLFCEFFRCLRLYILWTQKTAILCWKTIFTIVNLWDFQTNFRGNVFKWDIVIAMLKWVQVCVYVCPVQCTMKRTKPKTYFLLVSFIQKWHQTFFNLIFLYFSFISWIICIGFCWV